MVGPSDCWVVTDPAERRWDVGLCQQLPQCPLPLPVAAKAVQRFESGGDGSPGRSAPRQRLLLLEVTDKKVSVRSRAGAGRSSVTSLTPMLTPDL